MLDYYEIKGKRYYKSDYEKRDNEWKKINENENIQKVNENLKEIEKMMINCKKSKKSNKA